MTIIHYAFGPGDRIADALGADAELRSQMPGDVHLASLDGKAFYQFWRRPESGDEAALEEIRDDDVNRPMEFSRGIVARALGEIEEVKI